MQFHFDLFLWCVGFPVAFFVVSVPFSCGICAVSASSHVASKSFETLQTSRDESSLMEKKLRAIDDTVDL